MLTDKTSFLRTAAALLLAATICFAVPAPAGAQPRKARSPNDDSTSHPSMSRPDRPERESAGKKASVTHHVLKVKGRELEYKATAGFLTVRGESGKPEAEIFYISYVLDGNRPADRPLTFAFNGGPGASSMWVHLGAMGPRRIVLPKDGTVLPKRVRLVDNEQSWLPFTDMVFVDPVGCGYSRSAPGVDAKKFFSIDGDVRVLAEFIRLYVSNEGRWLSPKFLAGESYGTTRSAGLAQQLQSRDGMNIRGLVLMSSALNFGTFSFSGSSDLPYVLYLPTYTAEAWYHKKLPANLQKRPLDDVLAESEKWAIKQYAPALLAGDELSAAERKKIVAGVARFTGLSADYVALSDLRISNGAFAKQLLRDGHKVVGILDGRVTGWAMAPTASRAEYDPSLFLVSGPFAAAMQQYLRGELDFRTDRPYEFLSRSVGGSWDWGSGRGGPVDVSGRLAQAMTSNSNMKVLAAMGLYDLTCGYYSQRYTFTHMGLAPALQGNIRMRTYPSGHQIYNDMHSLKKLTADTEEFYKDCISRR